MHRSQYAGSANMDQTLFHTGVDNSTSGDWFVDTHGLPYALNFPTVVPYPAEQTAIDVLYPSIATFASSGG